MRTKILFIGLILALALPAAAQTLSSVIYQPPLHGLVTFVEPRGQFYINVGSKAQLYKGAQLQIVRDQVAIAQATVIKVDRLDAIGQLLPQFQGLRLQTGDIAVVTANPIPFTQPKGLPEIEPDLDQREAETVIGLLLLYGVVSAVVNN